ncbi:MAG: hypothetical protein HGA47_10290 [Zoogloea sp.]|nr:hypothetical protein [Zoogloea sp.]
MKPACMLLGLIAGPLLLSGCAFDMPASREPTYEKAATDKFLAINRRAVDQLFTDMKPEMLGDAPILVATIVNINSLKQSSPLGRSLSEQYTSRIVAKGYNVKELKLRGDLFVQEGTGELLLSREIKDIARSHSASVVLVGTYTSAADYTYVNLKLVRTDEGRIIGAHDYALPNNSNVLRLLNQLSW